MRIAQIFVVTVEALKIVGVEKAVSAIDEECSMGISTAFCDSWGEYAEFLRAYAWTEKTVDYVEISRAVLSLRNRFFKSVTQAAKDFPDGNLKEAVDEYLIAAQECLSRLVDGQVLLTTDEISSDCGPVFFGNKPPTFKIAEADASETEGCFAACRSIFRLQDIFSASRLNQKRPDEDKCKECFKKVFGTATLGKGIYPDQSKLEMMVEESQAIGNHACSIDPASQDCLDFQIHYQQPGTLTRTVSAADILKKNSELAKQRGYGEGKKLLIISTGGTFRKGFNGDQTMGEDPEAISNQQRASKSVVAFTRYIKYAYGIDSDILVSTYHTLVAKDRSETNDETLKGFYEGTTSDFQFMDFKDAEDRHVIFTRTLAHAVNRKDHPQLDSYAAVLFIRPDLRLKQGFFSYFEPFERLTLGFLAANFPHQEYKEPLTCDVLLYTPSFAFDILKVALDNPLSYKKNNEGTDTDTGKFVLSEHNWDSYGHHDVGFMLNTFHVTDTARTSNPLFEIVGRRSVDVSIDVGLTYDDFFGVWVPKIRFNEPQNLAIPFFHELVPIFRAPDQAMETAEKLIAESATYRSLSAAVTNAVTVKEHGANVDS